MHVCGVVAAALQAVRWCLWLAAVHMARCVWAKHGRLAHATCASIAPLATHMCTSIWGLTVRPMLAVATAAVVHYSSFVASLPHAGQISAVAFGQCCTG